MESLEGSLKNRMLGPISRVSDPVGPGWRLRIYVSYKFLIDVDTHAASPETTL